MSLYNIQTSLYQFMEFFVEFKRAYEELNPPIIYSVVEVLDNGKNEAVISIQIVNSSTIFRLSPLEIIKDKKLLEGFSKGDIYLIASLAQKQIDAPQYKLLTQFFDGNQTKFKLRKIGEKKCIEKFGAEISLDKDLLASLDSREAHLIGFVVASESALKNSQI